MAQDPRIDAYLAPLPPAQRDALQRIRAQVARQVPVAVETISYGMPAFKVHGQGLVWFAAWKAHCSIYPLTDRFLEAHADELKGYARTRGSLHFTPEAPLPDDLLEDLVRDRLADLEPDQAPRVRDETSTLRAPLVIAVAQPPTTPYDVAANALTHAATVRAAGARVVVFPELSLTGYELDAPPVDPDDPRLIPIIEACAETGSVALAGTPVDDGAGRSQIAILGIDGTRAIVAYRKMWLGGAEPDRFSPGNDPAALEVDGWRLGLAICRDTGIPRHAADTVGLGIDAYVAGVLESADDASIPAERAHRIAADHHVWVAVASFAGSTGGGYARAAGGSIIVAPDGVVVARAGPETGAIVAATLG